MTPDEEKLLANKRENLANKVDEYLGEPAPGAVAASPELRASYSGRLSEHVIGLWERYGFATFHNGLVTLTNPDNYAEQLHWWLSHSPLLDYDNYHVVARGPFGTWTVWSERSCHQFRIRVPHGLFAVATDDLKAPAPDELEELRKFDRFLIDHTQPPPTHPQAISTLDEENESHTSFYNDCVALHGPLTDPTQVFGFAPYLFMGGTLDATTVEPVNEIVQHELIREFIGAPAFKDISTYPG